MLGKRAHGVNLEIISREWGERGVTISIKGEIDIYTAAEVRQKVLDNLEAGRCTIVADLHQVTYLDSTGLGVLIGLLRRSRESGGDMTIVCGNPRLAKIFEITGMTKIFRLFDNEQDAIDALEIPEPLALPQ